MSEQGKNILIGVFILSALTIVVWAVLFLHPTVGDGKQHIKVKFVNIDSISVGTRVTLAGNPVGAVTTIYQVSNARDNPHNGKIYFYECVLAIDSHVQVYDTDEVMIATSGLFGERTISIIPKLASPGIKSIPLHQDQILYARPGDRLEEMMNDLSDLGHKVCAIIDENREAFHQALTSISNTFTQLDQDLHTLKEKDFWNNLGVAMHNARGITHKLDHDLHLLDEQDFWKNLSKTFDNFRQITHKISSGKGTIGHLVESDDVYLRLVSVMDKGEILLNDINHYGLLFHLNKTWQRLRLQRMDELKKLRSPSGFRDYFNEEVDQISTSISRVSMLLEEAKQHKAMHKLLEDHQFTHEFAELMHRIDDLEERMKLYNQQLVDEQSSKH
jgi:phospholipid/cholesterol/gamma-HCH transport system substrate-binding protein